MEYLTRTGCLLHFSRKYAYGSCLFGLTGPTECTWNWPFAEGGGRRPHFQSGVSSEDWASRLLHSLRKCAYAHRTDEVHRKAGPVSTLKCPERNHVSFLGFSPADDAIGSLRGSFERPTVRTNNMTVVRLSLTKETVGGVKNF